MKAAVVLCSGGLDSVVTAYHAKKTLGYKRMHILFFDYGQRTLLSERKFSRACAKKLGASFYEIDLSYLKKMSNSQIHIVQDSPLTRADLRDTRKESARWYVPARNIIFLSNAFALAESIFLRENVRCDIFVGFKHEGKEGYPDTTPEFVEKINSVGKIAISTEFCIYAPLIEKDKEDIVLMGQELGVNFRETISCYTNNKQCGTCLSCRLRQEGFRWANIPDPTQYMN